MKEETKMKEINQLNKIVNELNEKEKNDTTGNIKLTKITTTSQLTKLLNS
jgi:hypothetical protein